MVLAIFGFLLLNGCEEKQPAPNSTPSDVTLDSDGDGIVDSEDDLPLDPTETVDADGDGIGANIDCDDNDATMPGQDIDCDDDECWGRQICPAELVLNSGTASLFHYEGFDMVTNFWSTCGSWFSSEIITLEETCRLAAEVSGVIKFPITSGGNSS
jgi:hypothetical protein